MKKLSSSELDGAIYGSILGDSFISRVHNNGNANFTLSHSPKQKEYLEFKKQLFEQIHPVHFSFKSVNFFNKKTNKEYTTFYYVSNYLKYFSKLRYKFYPNGIKAVSRKILNKLTPLGLAIWWMDDGSLVIYHRKDRNAVNRYATLATCSFTYSEHLEIEKYFKEVWDIHCRAIKRRQKNKEYYILKFPMIEFRKLIKIIEPYIIDSMKYKIDLQYVDQNLNIQAENARLPIKEDDIV